MSEKLIIFILLVVYLARPKQPDEIQISGEMKSGCFYKEADTMRYILISKKQCTFHYVDIEAT